MRLLLIEDEKQMAQDLKPAAELFNARVRPCRICTIKVSPAAMDFNRF